MYPIFFSLLGDSSVRDGQLEKLWWGAGRGEGWQIHEQQERAYSGIRGIRVLETTRNTSAVAGYTRS